MRRKHVNLFFVVHKGFAELEGSTTCNCLHVSLQLSDNVPAHCIKVCKLYLHSCLPYMGLSWKNTCQDCSDNNRANATLSLYLVSSHCATPCFILLNILYWTYFYLIKGQGSHLCFFIYVNTLCQSKYCMSTQYKPQINCSVSKSQKLAHSHVKNPT